MSVEAFNSIIGMTPAEALVALVGYDINSIRPSSIDGKACIVTADYDPDRLNVDVIDGKITAVRGLG